ncbi:hypothetical protein BsWGS_04636 [Bradybaena similaris]
MPQKGDNIQTNLTVGDDIAEITEHSNAAQTKASTDVLSPTTKLNDSNSIDEISSSACTGSASLSLNLAQVECVSENIIEHSSELGTVTEIIEPGLQGNEVNVKGISTILDTKDAGVMYFSHDGTLVFDHTGLSSDNAENMPIILDPNAGTITSNATINSNYLVVVENIDGSQILSTTMQGNLVLSPENDISMSSISPHSQISFSTGGSHERSKLRNVSDYQKSSSITMVLDNATSHLSHKGLVVEPSSFIAYTDHASLAADQLTFHTVQPVDDKTDATALLYEHNDESFIDISALNVVVTEKACNASVNHAPTFQTAIFSAQATQTASNEKEHSTFTQCSRSILHSEQETLGISISPSDSLTVLRNKNFREASEDNEPDQVKKDRLKQELRFLEQCHLEHHLKQVQKKQSGKIPFKNEAEEIEIKSTMNEHADLSSEAETSQSLQVNVDDETPIFTNVTATLNSTVLAHIPGCQQFLLDKAQNQVSCFDIDFTSEKDCTFNGTLKSLVILHNIVKNLLKLKSKTLLEFRSDQSKGISIDKSVMCDLLKPYISLRGRQPRCSLKAAEMGFVNDVDVFLQTDTTEAFTDVDYDKHAGAGESSISYGRKRKRGRSSKGVKNKVKQIKMKCSSEIAAVQDLNCNASQNNSQIYNKDEEIMDACEVVPIEVVKESLTDHEIKQNPVASDGADLMDPLQQRLLEEQLKYRKIISERQMQASSFIDLSQDGTTPDAATVSYAGDGDALQDSSDICTEAVELSQENTPRSETLAEGRPRRGRPRKLINHLSMREKVHARNPLTESAATKQQRNYEEQVSFKFFCHQCSFKTKRHSHFLSHMRCHKDGTEKKYMCKQCDFVSISIPMLKRHELKHSKSLFKCGICAAYTTDRQELLRRHFRMKHSIEKKESQEGKLSCDQCRFSCLTLDELERHKTVHERLSQVADGDILSCPECKKHFRSRMHLHRHVRDVHGPEVRPHLCDTCGKAFKRTDALQQHKLVHISRTARSFPFKCSACGKGFRSPAHLKEHMSMHSTERPFLCQYCGAAFKTQPVQKKHIMTLHIRPRTHVCSVCCRQFNTKHALQRHENTHAKSDSVTEAAVLVIERENAMADKEAADEKHSALTSTVNKSECLSVSESTPLIVEGTISDCLVQDMIATSASEEPAEQSGQTLQQAYIQGSQDGTLYYFTGELPTL